MGDENFVKYWPRLTEREKAVLCYMLREWSSNKAYKDVHKGTLPFVRLDAVMSITWAVATSVTPDPKYIRTAKAIQAKLQDVTPVSTFMMNLNSAKVYRKFGNNPEKGKVLTFLPVQKVTVGKRWSLPKRNWVDDNDVLVSPSIALVHCERNLWEVKVAPQYRVAAERWLYEHCV